MTKDPTGKDVNEGEGGEDPGGEGEREGVDGERDPFLELKKRTKKIITNMERIIPPTRKKRDILFLQNIK